VVRKITCLIPPGGTLSRRRIGTVGLVDHASDANAGDEIARRIAENQRMINEFFTGQDDFLSGQRRFAHDPGVAPNMRIALMVCPVNVQNGEVGANGADCEQLFTGKRATDMTEVPLFGDISALDRPPR